MTYRTHNCGELRLSHVNQRVKLAGWVNHKRDFGKMTFITLRDHYGVTQLFFAPDSPLMSQVNQLKPESIIIIEGVVQSRNDQINKAMLTGEIEVLCDKLEIDSIVENLPFPLNDIMPNEELRLKYRFIDLRREKLHQNIILRSKIIYELRKYLIEQLNFMEIQTPILTVSSPEGARDFVVPCRLHPGKFYALPQAPQQYKQLLMCSGFDRYFQIAACFRDEAARADRSPGEFYQLDMELAFPTQDEIFNIVEQTFVHLNKVLPTNKKIVTVPFPRIPYFEVMEKYGTDKPDIRFGLEMNDVSKIFQASSFSIFKENSQQGRCIKAIVINNVAHMPNKFFKEIDEFSKNEGAKGISYLKYVNDKFEGPIAKFLHEDEANNLKNQLNLVDGDCILFCAGELQPTRKIFGRTRIYIAKKLNLIPQDVLAYCWVVDFPFFEYNEEEEKIDFCHNPFSMPQGGMEALISKNPLDILAYQYDIVCNGYELSSGAIRNHRPDIMYKAFEIVGYNKETVNSKFGHMISAFSYGAPPHGGLAPGIDRIVMIYADEENLREVVAFPMNQKAQDLMMGAPAEITQQQLNELNIKIQILP
ncbi:MAG: aspartate--tRNA ligase [Bacteroidales bacterium]|jgi:aspartyl-tRNA synthetase|nr:aspartate--tRNA ligase [Bacteroidales bacterium]